MKCKIWHDMHEKILSRVKTIKGDGKRGRSSQDLVQRKERVGSVVNNTFLI